MSLNREWNEPRFELLWFEEVSSFLVEDYWFS